MSKVLIGIIVVIAGYLAFNSLNSEEDNSVVRTDKEVLDTKEITPEPVEEMILQSLKSVIGDYGLQVTSSKGKKVTQQILSIKSDNTFEFRRFTMKTEGESIDESASGDFSYDKNMLVLTFSEQRNMTIFPEDQIHLTVNNDGNIDYNGFIFLKD